MSVACLMSQLYKHIEQHPAARPSPSSPTALASSLWHMAAAWSACAVSEGLVFVETTMGSGLQVYL